FGEAQQVGAAILPRLPAIGGADDAVHLQGGVDLVGPFGVLRHAHDAHGEGRNGPVLDAWVGQPKPARAAVIAAVDVNRRAAGIDALAIPRIDEKRPDLLALVGETCALECGTVIGAAPHAVDRAGKYDGGVGRMHEDGMTLKIGEDMLPLTASHRTAEDADLACLVRAPDIAGHAGEYVRLIRHMTFLLLLLVPTVLSRG